jgi:hypothetical protein
MGAPVVHFQMISNRPGELVDFYASLFGWTVDADNPLGYRRIDTGSTAGIQGGVWPAPPEAKTFVQLFIQVDDVAATVARAAELGARVLIPVQTLPDGMQMAVLHDPQGMAFAIQSRPAG